MALSCISGWNYLGDLLFQTEPIYCCQLHVIEDTENGPSFAMKKNVDFVLP